MYRCQELFIVKTLPMLGLLGVSKASSRKEKYYFVLTLTSLQLSKRNSITKECRKRKLSVDWQHNIVSFKGQASTGGSSFASQYQAESCDNQGWYC